MADARDRDGTAGPDPGKDVPAVWSEHYEADIGVHVFPTVKYRRVLETLLQDGTLRREVVREPGPASMEQLRRVHTAEYLRKIRDRDFSRREELTLEVPLTDDFRRASLVCAGGSVLAARTALAEGICLHVGGGFHHAFPDHGEGFCLIHDVAVAVRDLRARGEIQRAAIVDCDVHHGNGTAAIFRDDDRVFTFSMHQQHNYPFHKPPGDLDLGLPDGTADREYLDALEEHLHRPLDAHGPDLVFYLAGADPYAEDQLGGLSLTRRGLRERDRLVLSRCRDADVPVAICLAGGYARRLEDTVAIHCGTARAAAQVRRDRA